MNNLYRYRHLIVDLSLHLAVTLIISFIFYSLYKDFALILMVFIGGILIDLDHFIDYFLYAGFKFNLRDFLLIDNLKSGRIYIVFHSWELILLIYLAGLFLGSKRYALALSLGMLAHMSIDSFFQKAVLPYSIIYRWCNRFDAKKILPCFKNEAS